MSLMWSAAFQDLHLFAQVLLRIGREPFSAPPLQGLLSRLCSHTRTASQTIARLNTIVNLAGSRRNQAIALLAIPLMYSVNAALAAERWGRLHARAVRD